MPKSISQYSKIEGNYDGFICPITMYDTMVCNTTIHTIETPSMVECNHTYSINDTITTIEPLYNLTENTIERFKIHYTMKPHLKVEEITSTVDIPIFGDITVNNHYYHCKNDGPKFVDGFSRIDFQQNYNAHPNSLCCTMCSGRNNYGGSIPIRIP